MKKLIPLLLAAVMLFSLCACGMGKPKMTPENVIGTWVYTQGDLSKLAGENTLSLEIYRGGTAKQAYEGNTFSSFTWEISKDDAGVMNLISDGFLGIGSGITGFTIEKNSNGVLELHSVDGKIILEKSPD